MSISQEDVDELIRWMKLRLPRFAVCYKDESWLQRWIGRLLSPINRDYLTRYTTVMFGRVYFPSRAAVEEWGPAQVYSTLRHEFVHLMDARRFPLFFELSYLFLLPAGLSLRAWWELRGYTQNLILEYEERGTISQETLEWIAERFVGSDYGWMFPFPRLFRRLLQKTIARIESGELRGPYPYRPWGRSLARKESPQE